MDYKLLNELEDLHAHYSSLHGSVKVGITSGFRCEAHNKAEGGEDDSQHLWGRGVDFVVYRWVSDEWVQINPNNVINYLESKYPNRYGIGAYEGRSHFDTRSGGARRWTG